MGEFELLRRVRERLPAPAGRVVIGSGDDAAVTVPGGATATSVDALVEGVHFRRGDAGLRQIGGKAVATALSDLAAMGAEAGEAYVVLGVPEDLDEQGCMELVDGMLDTAERFGAALAGGDVTRAPVLTLAVTVVGHAAAAERLVTRSGARPGDAVLLTGELGGAAAALLAGELPEAAAAVPAQTLEALRRRLLEPMPRMEAGRALAEAGARAMIDLSDGLGGDARQLAEAGGVGLVIEAGLVPLAEGVAEIATAAGRDPYELAFSGGEDYELLAAMPAAASLDLEALARAAGTQVTRIGEAGEAPAVEIRLPGGRRLEPKGFDQLGG